MFPSSGLFRGISCPKEGECSLLNCVFSHDELANGESKSGPAPTSGEIYDPTVAGQDDRASLEPPPSKRRRRDHAEMGVSDVGGPLLFSASKPAGTKPSALGPLQKPMPASSARPTTLPATPASQSSLRTSKGTVSPPPIRSAKLKAEGHGPQSAQVKTAPRESLIPRPVPVAPATYPIRLEWLKMLHKVMKEQNDQMEKVSGICTLSANELVVLARDEEEQMARTKAEGIYRGAISARFMAIKKMKVGDWKTFVMQKFKREASPAVEASSAPRQKGKAIVTGLSPAQEIAVLRHLRTPLEGLEEHGYVTRPLSEEEIEAARRGVESANGWEQCDRCGSHFQVFPGRDGQGRLTSNGKCTYHWAKLRRPGRQKSDKITGQGDAVFPCCSKSPGTEGCTTGDSHVYKVTDLKRLASILQFKRTPDRTGEATKAPLSYDCEMAYTTFGMELIRLTAVSWPEGEEVLDILVRTQGEILDLNTRFSGVTKEQYGSAIPYGEEVAESDGDTSEDGEVAAQPLRKVSSPAAARQLLFDHLTPDTPLIGHAIDNDLNTCRIIHPFVVDTILLYPNPRGLPIRFGLKMLASKYLERGIQQGGEQGHDSKEDAAATGDLVRCKVAEKWKEMSRDGWSFQRNDLVQPPVESRADSN